MSRVIIGRNQLEADHFHDEDWALVQGVVNGIIQRAGGQTSWAAQAGMALVEAGMDVAGEPAHLSLATVAFPGVFLVRFLLYDDLSWEVEQLV